MRRVTVAFDVPATTSGYECTYKSGDMWRGWLESYPTGELVGTVVSADAGETDREKIDRLERHLRQPRTNPSLYTVHESAA